MLRVPTSCTIRTDNEAARIRPATVVAPELATKIPVIDLGMTDDKRKIAELFTTDTKHSLFKLGSYRHEK